MHKDCLSGASASAEQQNNLQLCHREIERSVQPINCTAVHFFVIQERQVFRCIDGGPVKGAREGVREGGREGGGNREGTARNYCETKTTGDGPQYRLWVPVCKVHAIHHCTLFITRHPMIQTR